MPGANAIHDLPFPTINGTRVYTGSIKTNWAHRLPERVYLDVAGAAHDWTGREPLKASTTLRFYETTEPGLYVTTWPKIRDLLLKGELLDFRHPELGKYSCRCTSVVYDITSESTAGVAVDVELTESIKSADQPTKFTTTKSEAAKAAEDADVAIGLMGLGYPDGFAAGSFGQMMDQLNSFDDLLSIEVNGFINQCKGYADSMYELFQLDCQAQAGLSPSEKEGLSASPFRWLLETALDSLSYALSQLAAASQAAVSPVSTTVTTGDTTIAALSLSLGVDVGGIIKLNPQLLGKSKIPKGTKVSYLAA